MPEAYNSESGFNICEVIDQHAELIDAALVDVEWNQQGIFDLTFSDGSTTTNTVPYVPDYVTTGLLLSLQSTPTANIVDYTAGTYQINAQPYSIAAPGNIAVNAGHPTLDRIDIIYVTTSNTIVYLAGTAATEPVPPTPPANTLVIAEVGVASTSTPATGGYTLQSIQFFKNYVNMGFLENQTLRWSNTIKRWVPNSQFRVSGAGFVGIQGAPDSVSTLRIAGTAASILIENIASDPIPSTNRLYAKSGNVYWNGIQLNSGTIPNGTVTNSTLRWNGATWEENTNFLTYEVVGNFGASTGTSFGTGNRNTVFGIDTIQSLSTGSNNLAVGWSALKSLTSGNRNTFVGSSAGESYTTGSDNVAVGYNALSSASTASQSVGLGNNTLQLNTGTGNIGIGHNAAPSLTSGSENIFIGKGSGSVLSTGNRNLVIGTAGFTSGSISQSGAIGYNTNINASNQFLFGGDDSFYNQFYFGRGRRSATASDVDFQLTQSTGTNKAGGTFTLRSGGSTGSGVGGPIRFEIADSSTPGTSENAYVQKMEINTSQVFINNGFRLKYNFSESVQTTSFTAEIDIPIYLVDSTLGALTITLPTSAPTGTVWRIKDKVGTAFTNNITIDPQGAALIDGQANYIMTSDYESIDIFYDGTDFYVL